MNILNSMMRSVFGGSGATTDLPTAQNEQAKETESNQVEQIEAQIQSDRVKSQAQIHQINMETTTKVAEMFRDSILNRVKSNDKLHQKWVQQMMA